MASGHQQGIMSLLGLWDARPCTYALAREVIDCACHGDDAGFVCVTGEISGWTAVVGPWCDPDDDATRGEVQARVEELSRVYGEAWAHQLIGAILRR